MQGGALVLVSFRHASSFVLLEHTSLALELNRGVPLHLPHVAGRSSELTTTTTADLKCQWPRVPMAVFLLHFLIQYVRIWLLFVILEKWKIGLPWIG